MNIALDMKTVFTLVVLGHLCTMILISAYRRHFAQDSAIYLFSMSKWLQAAVWGLSVFRFTLPGILGIALPNLILFIAAGLELSAVLKVIGGMDLRVKRYMILLMGVSLFGYLLIFFVYNTEWLRICFSSLMLSLFMAYPVYRLAGDKQASALKKTLSVMYGILCITLLVRAVLAVKMVDQMSLYSEANLYQLASYFSIFFMMLVGNIGFILLSKEQADERLLQLASYDDLTGALNRRTFIERAEQCIEELAESRLPVSFILFDIDHYKRINDTYGHEVGDRVLRDMTGAAKRLLEDRGILGRYGGDEFAILLPGLNVQESDALAEWLRSLLAAEGTSEPFIPYTVSMGIVTVTATKQFAVLELYKLSDQALYEAKRKGRNRVERNGIFPAEI
ncbi:GGDEF domain-containing protein [Paenibacillus physcomitrellae]|uniref:GGDEF domain-containing protein n=1 Tax=Paenibacillus physcomitrellae TaxID=1619311 RepID=A0ABQ1FYN7_9BACL|nr:GGDEF domain-containing protein [Paenibacillus physcomitrellae]GGA33170.1 GGDEF domain-containing protein [Paenibacillus physcomitrellae]